MEHGDQWWRKNGKFGEIRESGPTRFFVFLLGSTQEYPTNPFCLRSDEGNQLETEQLHMFAGPQGATKKKRHEVNLGIVESARLG